MERLDKRKTTSKQERFGHICELSKSFLAYNVCVLESAWHYLVKVVKTVSGPRYQQQLAENAQNIKAKHIVFWEIIMYLVELLFYFRHLNIHI